MAKLENLLRLIAQDDAEYMRLRRRTIKLPESERRNLEGQVNATLNDIKKKLNR